jgi:Xaa-Pro aminopeptidase
VTAPGERRIALLAQALAERDVQRLIVSAPANVRYLTGYAGSNGILVIAAGAGGGGAGPARDGDTAGAARDRGAAASAGASHLLLTDFRYETQAAQEVGEHAPCCERVIRTGDLVEEAGKLITEAASEPPAGGGRAGGGPQRIGFDERHLTVARHERLSEQLGERFELVHCAGLVERLREVKEPQEQRAIAAAAELADEALMQVLKGGLAGRSELQVALALEAQMRELGAQGASFPTIVAGGPHAALPHAQPRQQQIERGTLVTIDWGCVLDGYCSDCTRTYATGPLDGEAREVYELVLCAQQAGLRALMPGRSGKEVDADAREVVERAGYGERFGHGLGHGVGIEVHEGPRLSRTAGDEPLQEGNVVTVEPGVYLPGKLGVRIEDLAVVSAEGARILSSLPKELTVVG